MGQGESPDIYSAGTAAASDPGSCRNVASDPAGLELPYCFDMNVNVHNNFVTSNTSIGDELFSGSPAGAGGVTFCTGADYYKFNYNWICGNQSTGDGGGVAHLGFIWYGDIEHNTIIFNQSTNPTIATNGGGLIVMGAAPDGFTAAGIECGNTAADADCSPGLPDGTGPGLVINANLFQGNAAESGSGGGLRFQSVNGTEIATFPDGSASQALSGLPNGLASQPNWNTVTVTNNIITNNVAGWDGGGVSLQDALAVNLINNTIVSNDTTASSGVLFNTLGSPLASAPGVPISGQTGNGSTSLPQPAGLVTMQNSVNLTSTFPGLNIVCPTNNPNCKSISFPYLANDVFWQNRSFNIGVGDAIDPAHQQHLVSLYQAFTGTQAASQPATDATAADGNGTIVTGGTGACTTASYWDIGIRGDTGPGDHSSTFTLAPVYSLLTNPKENGNGTNILNADPTVANQYCNGARIPPEFGGTGYQVPPGISDATVPNPYFNLLPSATVDEGNNWINISWGPLTLSNPVTGTTLGNYALASGSPAIDYVPTTSSTYSVATWPTQASDFYGYKRPDPAVARAFDIGAVEFQGKTPYPTLTSIAPNSGANGTSVSVTFTGTNLTGAYWSPSNTTNYPNITVSNFTVVNPTTITATLNLAPNTTTGTKNLSVTTSGGTTNTVAFSVVNPPTATLTSVLPSTGVLGTSVAVTLTGANFTTGTTVAVSGTGVGVSAVSVVNSTTITATLNISATAGIGGHNITVTNASGTASNAVVFTVQGPTLTTISPTSGVRGTSVNVTFTGTNLTGATWSSANTTSYPNITVSNFTVVNPTTITATLNIASTTTTGTKNLSVTTPIGTTGTVAFSVVNPPTATLTSVLPSTGVLGTSVAVTLTGANFATGTTVAVSGTGVGVSAVSVVNSTTITATLNISATAGIGGHNITVTNASGTASNAVVFTVQGPTLTTISPTSGVRGTSVNVTFTGTNLTGATWSSANTTSYPNITVSNFTVVNPTTITATLNIASTTTTGTKNLSVTTPIGTTGTVAFNVN